MAVDITLLFRASVKTVKTRNKALGVAVGGGVDGSRDELFRRSPRPKGDFSSRAREVISHIGKLRDFLLEHRKDYINAYSHTMSEYGRMTDTERDQIDQDAQIFMRTCSEAIQQLRTEAHKEIHSQQVKEHRTAVLDFIEDYLKRVCKLYSEQRAIRVKRVVDKKRLAFAGGIKEGQAYLGDITDLSWNQNQIQRQENPHLLRKFHRVLQKTLKKTLPLKNVQKKFWLKHNLNWERGEMAKAKMSYPQKKYKCLNRKISD
ncbi:syntaxin 18, isoform CRA_c [Homo sapiens]|nr:syntaxin 18, isoform CRA_c [Homo sapiens]